MCNSLPAIHTLTGCDYTSKFGTKPASLKAPFDLIHDFGSRPIPDDDCLRKAEKYLVQVLKSTTDCDSMDQLRSKLHHHSKVLTLSDLPPSSACVQKHILRAYFCTYMMRTVAVTSQSSRLNLDPTEFGYEISETDGSLVPTEGLNGLPEVFGISCNCQKCANARCRCRSFNISCTQYCGCEKGEDGCKNPMNE